MRSIITFFNIVISCVLVAGVILAPGAVLLFLTPYHTAGEALILVSFWLTGMWLAFKQS